MILDFNSVMNIRCIGYGDQFGFMKAEKGVSNMNSLVSKTEKCRLAAINEKRSSD